MLSELNIEMAEKSYELAYESFQAGIVDQLELETVRKALLSARQRNLESRYGYKVGVINLFYFLESLE